MAYVDTSELLAPNPEAVEAIRKMYSLDKPGAIDEAIDILEEWIKQQAHFTVKEFHRAYLERLIIRFKGSIERAKNNLDKTCTMRTTFHQYFRDRNLKELETPGFIKIVSMPKLTKEYCRITMFELGIQHYDFKCALELWTMMYYMLEFSCLHDYSAGIILILDYRNSNMKEIMKTEWTTIADFLKFFLGGFGISSKAIHIVTKSKTINALVSILKQFSPAKYSERYMVHENMETVYEHLDKDLLPVEYGGSGPSFQILAEKWIDILSSEEFREYMKVMNAAKTDESLRQTPLPCDDQYGTAGTFRSLQVD